MEEGQRELVWSKQASHEDDGLARDAPMVTREEPVTTREASEEPVVGTVEVSTLSKPGGIIWKTEAF